jgi:predicted lipid-binding transport protein (Tim44 family)
VRYYIAPPPMNPVTRVLAGLLAVAALVGALFFGLIIFAAALGLGLLAWLILSVRIWWLKRRMPRGASTAADSAGEPRARGSDEGKVIDAEYEVISRREED